METRDVVKHMLSEIASRRECLELAADRGLGTGMLIEKWMLVEMLAKLLQLKKDGSVDHVEGEHLYPFRKTRRYEHCDLWWSSGSSEHWLEVKTVVPLYDELRWRGSILSDLEKVKRLRPGDAFHHLAVVFPINKGKAPAWLEEVSAFYRDRGLTQEAGWTREIRSGVVLIAVLFSCSRPEKRTRGQRQT